MIDAITRRSNQKGMKPNYAVGCAASPSFLHLEDFELGRCLDLGQLLENLLDAFGEDLLGTKLVPDPYPYGPRQGDCRVQGDRQARHGRHTYPADHPFWGRYRLPAGGSIVIKQVVHACWGARWRAGTLGQTERKPAPESQFARGCIVMNTEKTLNSHADRLAAPPLWAKTGDIAGLPVPVRSRLWPGMIVSVSSVR